MDGNRLKTIKVQETNVIFALIPVNIWKTHKKDILLDSVSRELAFEHVFNSLCLAVSGRLKYLQERVIVIGTCTR